MAPSTGSDDANAAAELGAAHRAGFVMDMRRAGLRDRRVLSTLEVVPRPFFVPPEHREIAFSDRALPIPFGQTIEKPSAFGKLLEELAIEDGHRVLEIGSGSGWSTACLAHLCAQVVGIERYRTLVRDASARLSALNVANATIHHADALAGLPGSGPYDRIVVLGSVTEIPKSWFAELALGGVLVAAIGPERGPQQLIRHAKGRLGTLETVISPVRWVPLTPGLARVD